MRIERFDPVTDEQQLRACHAMTVAGQPADDPNVPPMSFSSFRGWWAYGFSDNPMQAWLAADDADAPVGGYLLELPERENRKNAFGFVIVSPSRRRQGIGTALLAHLADQSAQTGRRLVMSATRVGAAGSEFAMATGAGQGLLDVRRRLDVDASLRARLAGLRSSAEPHAAGYSLRSWQGLSPAELVDGLCAVFTAMSDAPHEESFEPETWDPARLRAAEERARAQGTRWYSVAALAPSGVIAAITQVDVDPELADWGWQEITAVTRPHRGHRLGLLVKVAMLELLGQREPDLRRIMTYNAANNDHIVAVNDQLGYEVSDYFQCWEHDVARARQPGLAPCEVTRKSRDAAADADHAASPWRS